MCSNYEPVTDPHELLASFGVTLPEDIDPAAHPGDSAMAPLIVRAEAMSPDALGDARWGVHGLLPPFAPNLDAAKQGRTCRSENMKSMPLFRQSWWAGHRCVIPARSLLAWCYESGRPEMWGIQRADGGPMALAGLWNVGTSAAGQPLLSFTLLTLAAQGHPVFDRLDAPTAEKRMPAILPASAQQVWLYGSLKDVEGVLRRYPAEQLSAAARAPATRPRREPKSWAAMPDMFAFEWHMTAAEQPANRSSKVPQAPPARPVETHGPTTRSLF